MTDIINKIDEALENNVINEEEIRNKKYDFKTEIMLHAPDFEGGPAQLILWPASSRIEIRLPTNKTYDEVKGIERTKLKKEVQNLSSAIESAIKKTEENIQKLLK